MNGAWNLKLGSDYHPKVKFTELKVVPVGNTVKIGEWRFSAYYVSNVVECMPDMTAS